MAEWVSFLDSNEHEDIPRKKLKEVANLAIQKLVKYDWLDLRFLDFENMFVLSELENVISD